MSTFYRPTETLGIFIACFSMIAPLSAQTASLVSTARDSTPFNEYGKPVIGPEGSVISYSRQELEPMRSNVASHPPRHAHRSRSGSFDLAYSWSYSIMGEGIGKTGIVARDTPEGVELYLGGSTSTFGDDDFWYALRYDEVAEDFVQVFSSTLLPMGIRRIDVGNVGGAEKEEIVVGLADGTVQVHDRSSKTLLLEFSTVLGEIQSMALADLDSDGLDEIVLAGDDLAIYSGEGELLWELNGVGGTDIAVANMDDDPALEIATTDGNVVDATTQSTQWSWNDGFGAYLSAADIDADGISELIVGQEWDFVWAYDVDRELPKWSISIFDIGAVSTADVDGDGTVEVVIGDGQWGCIHAYDGVTLTEEWAIDNPEHGTTDVIVVDLDGDRVQEIIWGAGATSTGPDFLFVGDWLSEEIEWQSIHLDGPFIGPEIGDVTGDGSDEIVVVSTDSGSGFEGGRIVVLDPETRAVIAISDGIVDGNAWEGTNDLKLFDIDADGDVEIFVGADRVRDGVIEAYDIDAAGQLTPVWINATEPDSVAFYSVEIADVDSDGALEVIGGSGRESTGAEGVFLYVYDLETGAEEWHSLQMGEFWDEIPYVEVVDIDRDGALEMLAMTSTGDVYVFDGATKELEALLMLGGGSMTLLGEGENPSFVIGYESGEISRHRFDGSDYVETARASFGAGAGSGFVVGPMTTVWMGTEGALSAYAVGNPTPLWASGFFGDSFGRRTVFQSGSVISAGDMSVVSFDLQ